MLKYLRDEWKSASWFNRIFSTIGVILMVATLAYVQIHFDESTDKLESNLKDGKPDGLWTEWYENGQKKSESYYKDGKMIKGSLKFWNSKGEPVNSFREANKE